MPAQDFLIEVRAPSTEIAELLVGEIWEAGASGLEERERAGESGSLLIVYAREREAENIVQACLAVGRGVVVGRPEPIAEVAWSEAWKEGLEAITVSDRLRVRPSFAPAEPLLPGQREIVIDPAQAFGTGGHASTRLVLEWIDELAGRPEGIGRTLDIGTGTGVLALSALALGAPWAVGFDLDPIAAREASDWARRNGFGEDERNQAGFTPRLAVYTGSIDALAGAEFDLVVANLLKRELLPIADALVALVGRGGQVVLSGLLEADLPDVESALAVRGLRVLDVRRQLDGGDHWVSPLLAFEGTHAP